MHTGLYRIRMTRLLTDYLIIAIVYYGIEYVLYSEVIILKRYKKIFFF